MDFLTSAFVHILFLLQYVYADPVYLNSWAVHIKGGERKAREVAEKNGFVYVDKVMDDHYLFDHHHVRRRSTQSSPHHHSLLSTDTEVLWHEQQVVRRRVKRDLYKYNDPRWRKMWYLNRKGQPNMNVEPAWAKGYTGKRVVVSILDDGIEKDHPDLRKNYDSKASYDVNSRDPDPQPRYDLSNENRHGTRCAGEVAAQANNNVCSVGIAYDANIGGVRMLDGDVTDSVEAQSLSYNRQHIDIYSASWGPDDDGRTVDGPATLARKAFLDGVTKGRAGLGSIFVWASGNGGRDGDSCNCDGYTNSIYTLSISSVTEHGNIPWYSEACSSTLATTYSSGIGSDRQIVTTDLRKGCTEQHTGTSASAPLAAGICALALQANPNLSWRDMQHIVVRTAKRKDLHADDWKLNAVGRYVSHSYGYGLMDAAAMVELALNWTNVPEQHLCEIKSQDRNRVIPHNGKILIPLYSNGCKTNTGGAKGNHVHFLEHVQARITLTAARRGEVSIYLVSPQGTNSTLLARRVRDTSSEGFSSWDFMTTHTWGEVAVGTWTLEIKNGGSTSELKSWTLVLRGTAPDGNPDSSHKSGGGKSNTNGVANQQFVIPAAGDGAPSAVHEPLNGCLKSAVGGQCLDCIPGRYMVDGSCVRKCPAGFYGSVMQKDHSTKAICFRCHEGCLTCHGPSMHECFSCDEDWVKNGTSCIASFSIKPDQVKYLVLGVLGFFAIVILIVAAFIAIRTCNKSENGAESSASGKVQYRKINENGSDANLLDYVSESEDDLEGSKISIHTSASHI